ncbi:sulfatase-like hydrolase/transferase [Horticoccus sp. 23ND18S-11]|uniref:sulfatase-like hydrolase/transferase n=1 Tax=Horticoccus sp. 23ND18S-11 TaxID=3391832 RepID=UPI0039C999E3
MSTATPTPPGPKPPNVLWIVTTQWRAQACGYAGDVNARTPVLDALAAESVNYTQAVTPHPFGPFARAAMLTGVPSPENGVADYFDPLPIGARTIAHAMNERSYATAFFGKWHLSERERNVPLVGVQHAVSHVPEEARGGFAHWEGFEGGFQLNNPFLHGTELPGATQFRGYQSDVVCERALRWTDRFQSWFCVVSLEPPHPPYDARTPGVKPRNPSRLVLPPNVPRGGEFEARVRQELSGYHAHIEATDRALEGLISVVARENTIIVVTSVHGDMHGAHGLLRKGWPYEESVRVPFLVRMPAGGARRDASAVSLLDLPAMTQAWVDGRDWTAPSRAAKISMPSVVALPHQCDRPWRGVRTPARKLVLNADGSPWLAFDLERDPGESTNLAADPARAAEFAGLRDLL